MSHELFISYRHEDEEWASKICNALESRGVGCWVSFRDIAEGENWADEIVAGLKQSKFFAVILSSHSVNEEQISREVRIAADELKLRVFPIRVENVQPPARIGYFLGDVQWLDVFDGKFEAAMDKLARRIRGEAARPDTPQATGAPAPVPVAPINVPAPQPGNSKSMLWIGIGVAVLVIAAIVIALAMHRPQPGPAPSPSTVPDGVSQAATSYLNSLGSGNFQAAWGELTPARRGQAKYIEWLNERKAVWNQEGPFKADLKTCQALANSSDYSCDFQLTYRNGDKRAAASVNVAKEENGSFGVDVFKHAKPQ